MVSPAEWGPNAWMLLHGLAERVGNQPNLTTIRDEQNEIRFTLKDFWALLPCKTCQLHYKEWVRKNPPDIFASKNGGYLQEDMRLWVYNLHNEVNSRREINVAFPESSLEETYGTVDLRKSAFELKSVYQRGVQTGVLKPEDWKRAWKHLDLLLRFIGV